jgi:hypothetical protein
VQLRKQKYYDLNPLHFNHKGRPIIFISLLCNRVNLEPHEAILEGSISNLQTSCPQTTNPPTKNVLATALIIMSVTPPVNHPKTCAPRIPAPPFFLRQRQQRPSSRTCGFNNRFSLLVGKSACVNGRSPLRRSSKLSALSSNPARTFGRRRVHKTPRSPRRTAKSRWRFIYGYLSSEARRVH